MSNLHNENNHAHPQNLQVWYCENCQSVHFRTRNVMLDFSRKEFIDLTNVLLEVFQDHFDPLEINQIANSAFNSDEVLLSETIS